MTEELDKLEALAKASLIVHDPVAHRKDDRRFRIAANPQAILSLIQKAREAEGLRAALGFYAEPRRYNGANQSMRRGEADPFTGDAHYLLDVTRDGGNIARQALENPTKGTT